jgi:hypothetical protein
MGEGVFDANPLHVDPLRRAGKTSWIVADKLLAQIEIRGFPESQQRFEREG